MSRIAPAAVVTTLLAALFAFGGLTARSGPSPVVASTHPADTMSVDVANETVQTFCQRCHNDRALRGNLSLASFDASAISEDPEVGEKIIRKLRAGMMPPSSARRPEEAVLAALAGTIETRLDRAAAADPDPGYRPFQRLNRAEYERSIHELFGLEIDADAFLPPETMSAGFDNIADAQVLSATLIEAYLTAAGEIARMAVGDPRATPAETSYEVSRYAEQRERVEGAPFGTRGGLSVIHNFPADGEYTFRMSFITESTGNFFGQTSPFEEQIEISVDGERKALLDIDRFMHVQDPNGANLLSEPIAITAGPHRVSAAFLRRAEGPVDDVLRPHAWSVADHKIGYSYGITSLPHLQDLAITGPYNVTGVSETPVRERIFTCRPSQGSEEEPCAREILTRIAAEAYRRPVTDADVDPLMKIYREGADQRGFEFGVRTGLQAVLASPDFVFRFEEPTHAVEAGDVYQISGLDLATRLAFFLWGTPPDEELVELGHAGKLGDPAVLRAQAERMLEDPRADALGERFAYQWLRLFDLDKVHPDPLTFPDYHEQLSHAMITETELFFNHVRSEGLSLFELLTADYTFVNERLARHYGIPGVSGDEFRMVSYPNDQRRGLLGHGSVLTLTSHADRTSPVLRGKWVMEVLLGSPPPPPPPNVPTLEEQETASEGRVLTVRERMEQHRANPTCNACHIMMDPIGLALENYDVTGRWRIKDAGAPVEADGTLYDGSTIEGVEGLRNALLRRPESVARSFTENLMAYALGRRIEARDMPTVRAVVAEAAKDDYRLESLIEGVIMTDAFRFKRAAATTADAPAGN